MCNIYIYKYMYTSLPPSLRPSIPVSLEQVWSAGDALVLDAGLLHRGIGRVYLTLAVG